MDAPDPVPAGANLTYTITVSNEGPDEAADAEVTDPLPAGTTFVAISVPGGWSCATPAVGANGTVTCTSALFAAGSAVFDLTVQVGAGLAAGTVLTNTATVSSSTPDPNPGDESDTVMTTVGTGSGNLALDIADAPDPVSVGSGLTYIVTLTSTLADAANGTLTLPVPTGTTFQSFAGAPGWSCSTPPVGGTGNVACTNPSPPAPGVEAFTLAVQVGTTFAAGDTVDALASLVLDSSGRDVVASATESTAVLSPASLTATKSLGGALFPGGSITYTLVVTNAGPGAQSDNPGPELTDVLPAELTLTGATATSGVAVASIGTNTVTWNGSIPAGGNATISITATVGANLPAGTSISNQAGLAYDADGDGGNEAAGLSDDPEVAGGSDPTTVVLGATPVTQIPTLNEAGLAALALLLAVGGVALLRRKGLMLFGLRVV